MKEWKIYRDEDADLQLLRKTKVAVIGYGSQGRAQALNLRESEVPLVVGLRDSSPSALKACEDGMHVLSIAEAVKEAEVIMLLIPDEIMANTYQDEVLPHLSAGKFLAFSHGFNVHFGLIKPPAGVGVFMVAPKGPGQLVRTLFTQGSGVPCLVATKNENEDRCLQLALSYAKAIGGTRMGAFRTSFREETETDLFGEQAVLCGGLTSLMKSGFEVLVENGYHPVMAYFECIHEMKLIVDLIYESGFHGMRKVISNTAEFGDYTAGRKVVDPSLIKERMQGVLESIKSGAFAREWMEDARQGLPRLHSLRKDESQHPVEEVRSFLRRLVR